MTGSGRPRRHGTAGPGGVRNSAARLAAVQALYQIDRAGTSPDAVLEEFLRFRLGDSFDTDDAVEPNRALFTQIVRGASARLSEIDEMLSASLSTSWPPERLEPILRAILRAGAYELVARTQTPARVVISEYVDAGHAFYDGAEPGMVNGVLDRLARAVRPDEFAGEPASSIENADGNGAPDLGEAGDGLGDGGRDP